MVSTFNRTAITPKSGPASIRPHTRTVWCTRIKVLRHITSNPVPRPHGDSGGGTGGSQRPLHVGTLADATFASGRGLLRRPAAASPYTCVRSPNLSSELIAKHEMVNLIAQSDGKHERVAKGAAVSFHRAMLTALHSMRVPTNMQMHEAGRSCA